MWWRPEHTQYDIQAPKEPMFVCPFCNNYSPVLYEVGLICLCQGCPVFWTVRKGAALSLNNDFLLYVLATDFDPKDEEFDAGGTSAKPLAYHCSQCSLLTPQCGIYLRDGFCMSSGGIQIHLEQINLRLLWRTMSSECTVVRRLNQTQIILVHSRQW